MSFGVQFSNKRVRGVATYAPSKSVNENIKISYEIIFELYWFLQVLLFGIS